MTADLNKFFENYTGSYNQALGDRPDFDRIRSFFSDCFVNAGPEGVQCGKNDDSFTKILQQGYGFYRAIRTQRMNLRKVEVKPVDDANTMAKVFYRADYKRASGEDVSIDFDVTYLLHLGGKEPKIFAFIAGDEMALYKQHGLVDEQSKPL